MGGSKKSVENPVAFFNTDNYDGATQIVGVGGRSHHSCIFLIDFDYLGDCWHYEVVCVREKKDHGYVYFDFLPPRSQILRFYLTAPVGLNVSWCVWRFPDCGGSHNSLWKNWWSIRVKHGQRERSLAVTLPVICTSHNEVHLMKLCVFKLFMMVLVDGLAHHLFAWKLVKESSLQPPKHHNTMTLGVGISGIVCTMSDFR